MSKNASPFYLFSRNILWMATKARETAHYFAFSDNNSHQLIRIYYWRISFDMIKCRKMRTYGLEPSIQNTPENNISLTWIDRLFRTGNHNDSFCDCNAFRYLVEVPL